MDKRRLKLKKAGLKYRVLVADDEPEFRAWLQALLDGSPDFSVVGGACNGSEAVSLAGSLQPDLVIADIYMPDMDGLEVARYIRQHFPGMKTILVSAYRERAHERLARQEGAVAFISKESLSLPVLLQALRGGS